MPALIAACGDSAALPLPQRTSAVYDPLAAALPAPRGVDNVKTLPGLQAGRRSVVATSPSDELDPALQQLLQLEGDASCLKVALAGPVTDAVFYVRYDGRTEHFTSFKPAQATGHVSLVCEVEPGLLAVALSATTPAGLPAGALVELNFAPGPSLAVRSASVITDNQRATVTDISFADNGDASVTLQWSERHPGDYDQNGEVNVSDLTKIGQNYRVIFTPASPNYARLEVIDGDQNGEINGQGDLTVIGQNIGSSITGYNIYRTTLNTPGEVPLASDSARWTKLENAAEPDGPTVQRVFNGQDFRLVYTFLDASGGGDFGWFVRPTGPNAGEEGRISDVATFTVGSGQPPDAGLSFEIQPPAGGTVNPGDDIYIAIKVTGAAGLFSANVRFEYDSSLLQFMEIVPAYNDGTDHPNILSPPLFIGADNVGSATVPYRLIGFNATQTLGTPAVTADGALAYVHFTAIGGGVNNEALRFPQSSNFIYLWGEQYGVPVLTPALGSPLQLAVIP